MFMKEMYYTKDQAKKRPSLKERFKCDISGNETLTELTNKIVDNQLRYAEHYKTISSKFVKKND